MEEQLINVIFDPNFQSFDQELANLSMDKMMSIQFSEELLQKNFAVLISILKQLHKGMVLLNSRVQDNSDWVQKLKEVSETPETKQQSKDTIDQITSKLQELQEATQKDQAAKEEIQKDYATKEELDQTAQRFNRIVKQQEQSLLDLESEQTAQAKKIEDLNNTQTQQSQLINQLNQEIENIKRQMNGFQDELHEVEERKPEQIIVEKEIIKETPVQPMALPIQYNGNDEQINKLNQIVQELKQKQEQQSQELVDLKEALSKIKIPEENPPVDLSDINKKLDGHEEEIQSLFEIVDSVRQKLKDQNNNQQSDVSSEELNQIKSDIKKLQSQIEALQTQLNLATFGQGQDMQENQVALILVEINKLRDQLQNYCTTTDFQNENTKKEMKMKSVQDHADEELEKARREFKSKNDKKAEQTDIAKLEKDISQLREQLGKSQQRQSSMQIETPLRHSNNDKELLHQIKELQQSIKEIENDLLIHKTQMNQNNQQTHVKLAELEKKIQGIQTDKIYIELQNQREQMDLIKRDQDQNKIKINNFGKKIESIVTKDELFQTFDPKIKQVRDDIQRIGDETKLSIDRKADAQEVKDLNQAFLDQLQKVVTELIKTLANKQETKKALIYLEQKINQIFMILEGDGSKDQDSLFVKKPLSYSCASCDKELDKYKGQLGDFKNWAVFPPKETSPERMGKFGIGYKNMQEKLKSNREKLEKDRSQNEKESSQHQQSMTLSQSQTQLPKIKQ
ncbi:unnamed protein product (macronuclear) [Paramecium tetraurelia]|uniref:Uncharacterized protein n=1 Tax=Paramecium tetraurelia TaxID=5888 RepID=A0BMK9_PARTE|nr:uncharacterized protein GSPATT00030412001 [Paramecium tetraurelia]CAK59776.1 unnamed protein product [Paramecium tetraurelia]|eukprot:XP_001427174.1 hypothetical protein (macronuclear) [Paramecium tetraurelia strain d4-2]